jgi:hypothetical protein
MDARDEDGRKRYRHIALEPEVYEGLSRLRNAKAKELGFRLDWGQYVSILIRDLRGVPPTPAKASGGRKSSR